MYHSGTYVGLKGFLCSSYIMARVHTTWAHGSLVKLSIGTFRIKIPFISCVIELYCDLPKVFHFFSRPECLHRPYYNSRVHAKVVGLCDSCRSDAVLLGNPSNALPAHDDDPWLGPRESLETGFRGLGLNPLLQDIYGCNYSWEGFKDFKAPTLTDIYGGGIQPGTHRIKPNSACKR